MVTPSSDRIIGHIPSLYSEANIAKAVDREAKEVPTTVTRPESTKSREQMGAM